MRHLNSFQIYLSLATPIVPYCIHVSTKIYTNLKPEQTRRQYENHRICGTNLRQTAGEGYQRGILIRAMAYLTYSYLYSFCLIQGDLNNIEPSIREKSDVLCQIDVPYSFAEYHRKSGRKGCSCQLLFIVFLFCLFLLLQLVPYPR